ADANKIEIKKTIKAIYNVDVKSVNIVKMPRKTRLGRKRLPVTKRSQYKKAIITLKNNKTIDINVFAKEEKTKKVINN
ncbi:50S ribosomal protein L23, partial [Candidatus Peregrinibacteria bacterium RIFOXYB2_FULL_32_7]